MTKIQFYKGMKDAFHHMLEIENSSLVHISKVVLSMLHSLFATELFFLLKT